MKEQKKLTQNGKCVKYLTFFAILKSGMKKNQQNLSKEFI